MMLAKTAMGLAALLLASACASNNSATSGPVDNSEPRRERILENLKEKFPALNELSPQLGEIKAGPACMNQVEMTVQTPRGPQTQTLLLTPDGKQLYMVVGEPIDVSKDTAELQRQREQASAERLKELEQLAARGPGRGPASAPVTIVEFSDFQCPYCKRAAETVDELLAKYPEQVRLVFFHYPLPFHDWARPAAIASVCAAEQDAQAFWKLHDAYFANQATLSMANVLEESKKQLEGTGVDLARWSTCATEPGSEAHKKAVQEVEEMMTKAQKLGVDGTPAFFINGELISGAVPLAELERAVQAALAKKQ